MNIGQYLQEICTTTNLLIRVVLNFGRTSPLCYRMLFQIIYLVKLYGCSFVSVAFALFFHPRICMDVYAGNYRKESISFSSVDAHGMQMVIVQDAVVYPFAGCAVFIDFFYIPVFLWQPEDKGAHPIPVLYRHTVHMGIWSIYPGTDNHPLCGRPAGSAICSGCGRNSNPSIPSGNRPGIWAFHPYRL